MANQMMQNTCVNLYFDVKFVCAQAWQMMLVKMASPVWQFYKVSEKDNKIA